MPSFDVVCEVDNQEVKNAVDQVQREVSTRYDLKDSRCSVEHTDIGIILVADDQMKLKALQEILKQKLAKRGVSLKSVDFQEARPAGGDTLRQEVHVKEGLNDEELKRVNKIVKECKLKLTSQIQGQQVRVSGKKRDDLQGAIAALRAGIPDIDLQFTNFRE